MTAVIQPRIGSLSQRQSVRRQLVQCDPSWARLSRGSGLTKRLEKRFAWLVCSTEVLCGCLKPDIPMLGRAIRQAIHGTILSLAKQQKLARNCNKLLQAVASLVTRSTLAGPN